MSYKGFLKKAFQTAAFATIVLTGSAAFAQVPASSVGRPLTAGEKGLAYLFGDTIHPDQIRWHAGPSQFPTAAETFDEKTIAAYDHPFLSLDYSQDRDPFNYGMYFHETTHTWQFANGWRLTAGHCPGGYLYDLRQGMKLTDFCSEAQAAIVEDYARRYIRPISTSSNWYVQSCGHDSPENDSLLVQVVEEQFPHAREMRLMNNRGISLPDATPLEPGTVCKRSPSNGNGRDPHGAGPQKPPDPGQGNDPQKGDPKGKPNGPDGKGKPGGDGPDVYKPLKRGKPTFFCDALDYTFSRIGAIAAKEGVKDWQPLTAKIDDNVSVCIVSAGKDKIAILSAGDFKDGLMRGETLANLVDKISQQSPDKIRSAVGKHLSALFNQMSDRQKAEKQALTKLKTREAAVKTLAALQTQLKEDPSLPDNSRAFLEEKVKIVERMIAKFDGKDAGPDVQKPMSPPPPPVSADGNGHGGGKKPVAKPVKKAEDNEFLDPDRNIKKLIDSAYGKAKTADARHP